MLALMRKWLREYSKKGNGPRAKRAPRKGHRDHRCWQISISNTHWTSGYSHGENGLRQCDHRSLGRLCLGIPVQGRRNSLQGQSAREIPAILAGTPPGEDRPDPVRTLRMPGQQVLCVFPVGMREKKMILGITSFVPTIWRAADVCCGKEGECAHPGGGGASI